MPKGYIIGHVTVNDPEDYQEYMRRNTPILTGLGGRFLIRGGQSEILEGTGKDRHVVVEFPDYDSARAAYNDPEYQKVARIRHRTASSDIILVEGTE